MYFCKMCVQTGSLQSDIGYAHTACPTTRCFKLERACLHSAILGCISLTCVKHQKTAHRQSLNDAPHTLIQPLQNCVELLFTKFLMSSVAQNLMCLVGRHIICIDQTGDTIFDCISQCCQRHNAAFASSECRNNVSGPGGTWIKPSLLVSSCHESSAIALPLPEQVTRAQYGDQITARLAHQQTSLWELCLQFCAPAPWQSVVTFCAVGPG